MGKQYFTEEQLTELRKNPYVKKASKKSITYTDEFRILFYTEYRKGKLPSTIVREMGFDPRMLGKRRLNGFVQNLKKYEERGSFEDKRTECSGRPKKKELTIEEQIARLEHQVKYLKQENEYLKKIEFLDKKAQWEQEQKHRKNLK